jgi:hypothetical protein
MMVPRFMSWLLIVQPDSAQADLLREALRTHVSEDVVVADSIDNALSSIDQCIPDIVLLAALIPADVEDYVISYLGTIPSARHVRVLGIPVLERPDHFVQQRARSLMPWRQRQGREPLTPGCDPGTFTRDVIRYLSGVRTLKDEIELHGAQAALSETLERRTEPRFSRHHVPWISVTRFGLGRAALVNVSSRGVLLRTQMRPDHHALKRSDRNVRERSHLTLELSGHEVDTMGRVVRCVPLGTGAGIQYEIAFCFDDSVGLHLPAADALVPTSSRADSHRP